MLAGKRLISELEGRKPIVEQENNLKKLYLGQFKEFLIKKYVCLQ